MAAIQGVPHPFPYQGSKRQLASQIIQCIPSNTVTLIEPFAGSAAVTLAAAYLQKARRFVINDIHEPLTELWKAILSDPHALAAGYRDLWTKQQGCEREFYDEVRDSFNKDHRPPEFLYLLARCVKAAVRYNDKGEFNNSPDNRRKGMHPDAMEKNITFASNLLRGKVRISCQDYRVVLGLATSSDVVYMDPPYQGVYNGQDQRYYKGVPYEEFVDALDELNKRDVPYVVSYDGRTGDKVHGRPLPEFLCLTRMEILVGRSTQATLLGRSHQTFESLYLSPKLLERLGHIPPIADHVTQSNLFAEAK